jgi:hypothetical protein
MATEARFAERLQQLRAGIERWRLTRRKHGPMPDALWDEAASLARSLGACPVSRALGIGYSSLQQRASRAVQVWPVAPSAASISGFVELSGTQLIGAPAPGATGAVVELTAGDGARLTVRLPAGSTLDVAALVVAFQGRRP